MKEQRVSNSRLTAKQERFCQLVAQGYTQTDAYIEAYGSKCTKRTARVQSTRMMDNPKIQAYLKELTEKVESEAIMNISEAQKRLTSFARREPQADAEGYSYPSIAEATKAIELLMKAQGGFIERRQIEMNGAIPVVIKDDVHE